MSGGVGSQPSAERPAYGVWLGGATLDLTPPL